MIKDIRYQKTPSVILAGSTIKPSPRPPPLPTPLISFDDNNNNIDEAPSYLSELLKGGSAVHDPYISFYDDIAGWEEESDELVIRLVENSSSSPSFKYLTCQDSTSIPAPDSTPKIKKKAKPKKKEVRTPSPEPILESEIQTSSPPVEKQQIEKTRPDTCPRPRKEITQFDFLNAPPTDRMALLRKRLISSASTAKSTWASTTSQPDLGMAVLFGKKYHSLSNKQKSPEAKERTILPQITPPIDIPQNTYSFQKETKDDSLKMPLWNHPMGSSARRRTLVCPTSDGSFQYTLQSQSSFGELSPEKLLVEPNRATPEPPVMNLIKEPVKVKRSFRSQIALKRSPA